MWQIDIKSNRHTCDWKTQKSSDKAEKQREDTVVSPAQTNAPSYCEAHGSENMNWNSVIIRNTQEVIKKKIWDLASSN